MKDAVISKWISPCALGLFPSDRHLRFEVKFNSSLIILWLVSVDVGDRHVTKCKFVDNTHTMQMQMVQYTSPFKGVRTKIFQLIDFFQTFTAVR